VRFAAIIACRVARLGRRTSVVVLAQRQDAGAASRTPAPCLRAARRGDLRGSMIVKSGSGVHICTCGTTSADHCRDGWRSCPPGVVKRRVRLGEKVDSPW
jgi:hypothetical protein